MIQGVKFKISPNPQQKALLSQWMGAQRFIWNAKVSEEKYLRTYARKYLPVGTYADFDQTYSQYKSKELCPWIYDIPSQLLRNASVRWYQTFQRFLKGNCGRPRIKKKKDEASVYITRELFWIEAVGKSYFLHLGTKKNSIGRLRINAHRPFKDPASITIRKKCGRWYLSFSFGEDESPEKSYQADCLSMLRDYSEAELSAMVVGIDRGVAVPFQVGEEAFALDERAAFRLDKRALYIKRQQRRLSRQVKGSKRREKTKRKISKAHSLIANVRHDFIHKATYKVCMNPAHKVFVFEDLKIKSMSRAPKAKPSLDGKSFARNGSRAKAGLNKSILAQAWSQYESVLRYKSRRHGKTWFKISPQFTSQECAACGAIHPGNRPTRADFQCLACDHRDHADRNAAMVIKKRAIRFILHSGTELSAKGVLTPGADNGRGAKDKTLKAKADKAFGSEASKKKRLNSKVLPLDFVLEASPL